MTDNKSKAKPVEKKSKSNTKLKVAGGILAGAAAGAIAGILLAPDSGKNTRNKIAAKSKQIAKDTKEKAVSSFKSAVVAGKKKLGGKK